jgi:F0F1-type ATP synthase assembly protein I
VDRDDGHRAELRRFFERADECRRAVAGILSPVAFGWLLDRTGSWTTPFAFSVGLLLFAIVVTWWIRPDRPIESAPSFGRLAVAGE